MELAGSGSCIGYRQIHQRLRDDHGLVVDRYTAAPTIDNQCDILYYQIQISIAEEIVVNGIVEVVARNI